MKPWIWAIVGIALGALPVALPAQDAASPVDTVKAFRQALESGNERAALEFLAPELLVYESGDQNRSRGDYAGHHLHADMAFLAKVKVHVLDQIASSEGALAWVATRSRIAGGGADLVGTETMVLRREAAGWRIVHVHWSSRPATRNDE